MINMTVYKEITFDIYLSLQLGHPFTMFTAWTRGALIVYIHMVPTGPWKQENSLKLKKKFQALKSPWFL